MGYYILGIIIFLLVLVFISDLVSASRNRNDDHDIYYDQYTNSYYNEFGESFPDEDRDLAEKNDKNPFQKL